MKKWFLGIILVGICVSCSIQKRVHTGGYYIKWHKHYKKTEDKANKEKLVDTTTVVVFEDTLSSVEDVLIEPQIDTISSDSQKHEREKLDPLPRKERKFEPLGVLAFKILLLDIPVGFLADNVNVNEIRKSTLFGLLFIAIVAVSFVLAVISMIRYLRNPKHYRFNFFALVVIAFAVFFLIECLYGNFAITIKLKSLFW